MSKQIKIKKGLDLKLVGTAEKSSKSLNLKNYALKPTDFHGLFPKLMVRVGDKVKAGSPIFFDKYRDNIIFTSPVSGTITDVIRGAKRKMLEIRIESDGTDSYETFKQADPKSLKKEEIIEELLKSGVWPLIRQRPYTVIANPVDQPKAIFISGFDTAPLAADIDFILEGKEKEFQTGLDALSMISDSNIHLNLGPDSKAPALLNAKGVEINNFSGPHPAGNVGIQIHHISPINKGDIVWTVNAADVLTIGRLFLEGKYNAEKMIALCGSEVKEPQYITVKSGVEIGSIVKDQLKQDHVRIISGNVFTGTRIDRSGYLSYYSKEITVIPEGDVYEFFGWLVPSPKKHSFYRTAFSWLMPNKSYKPNTNMNGGERAFVFTGALEQVFPMDILPIQLMKAIMAEDIDLMEQLGIYELDEEDFALCEYISTSKIDMQELIRKGLDMMRIEMS
ncbi:MAG: Na(+)-translocating NADH-quinone reductase subunit A [Bacteroidales bacterium]|nr:Na(+)-translocating NADH-quinone reductase subunit A [Bacteroidales bacterium]